MCQLNLGIKNSLSHQCSFKELIYGMNLTQIDTAEVLTFSGTWHKQNQPKHQYLFLLHQQVTRKQNLPKSRSQKEGENENEMKTIGSKNAKSEQEIVVKATARTRVTRLERGLLKEPCKSHATTADRNAVVESVTLKEKNCLLAIGDLKIQKNRGSLSLILSNASNLRETGVEVKTRVDKEQKQFCTSLKILRFVRPCF